ncbi:FtsX-like permease family protein [Aeoliella sp.]|uniref:ABC transporter permease n=1 Tax=Aeoliella sp. TaxID=2795800 RepID=UPI003CCBC921
MPQRHRRQSHLGGVIDIDAFSYIVANLRHHWRMHLAVAAAVAVATAVLTGALVVGDSVRGSLRDLTLQRLGRIDQVLTTPRLFRAELASELAATEGFEQRFESAMPALILRGSATARVDDKLRRASELDLYGVTEAFWSVGERDPRSNAGAEGVWITQQVANDLGVAAGDEILLQLPLVSDVPADSPLGEKVDTVAGERFRVAGVLPDRGLARFGLRPSQRPPRAVFAPLEQLASAIEQPGRANAILVTSDEINRATDDSAGDWLAAYFDPELVDLGLAVEQHDVDGPYVQISAEGLVIPPEVVLAAQREFAEETLQPIITYLANTLEVNGKKVPYSTVTGVYSSDKLGPTLDEQGKVIELTDDQIVLNRWAADQLDAEVGDKVTLRYYEPESTHGNLREHEPPLELTLAAIVELQKPDGTPTAAADPNLTPQLEGVTDQQSIADWDLPFELVERITQHDEDYWDEFRTTPKAFVSFRLASATWSTRWGSVSLLRTAASEDVTAETVAERLRAAIDPGTLGFTFMPVKAQGLAAASGTTPFDGLFLGFSMFLIASAIMLLVLLFRLGIESRAQEIGLLSAVGFDAKRSRRLLTVEAMCVAAAGALVGVLLGIFYAWAMVTGLKTLWVAAISAPFLQVHVGPWSLPIGLLLGLATAWATTWWTLRSVLRQSPRGLLAGVVDDRTPTGKPRRNWHLSELMLLAAVGLAVFGTTIRGEAQAGAFFGVGALVLAGLLGLLRRHWQRAAASRQQVRHMSLVQLALANLARRPGRSTLTVGLVAAASFLLLSISAFRLAPTEEGTGGYDWFTTSDVPLHYDFGTEDGQIELAFRDEEMDRLAGCRVESLRVHGGEDASCLNLYRTAQPRVVGVRDSDRVLADFAWGAKLAAERAVPDLSADLGTDEHGRVVPVVLDFATAMYSLHLSGSPGDRLTIRDGDDQLVTLEVVGLLKNSILQGDLVVSDENFRRLYPGESGSQLFLIKDTDELATDAETSLSAMLEDRLGDYGMAVTPASDRLAGFLAVQNTYLSTFQVLGGLGLLLGTIGLAVVQLRNVLERRGELALVQAVGFSRRRVVALVLLENLALLLGGLLLGGIAAALALLPQLSVYQTALPWRTMLGLLAVVVAVGVAATWLATRGALRQAILPALRGD